ncbi:MAG: NAD(P)H-dependent oxidoreductase [Deltaproteobacteria bacterium]|nr:NAD(P)H-dependent oxidoreductase [Deltaproteobacteria bacterium]
MLTLMVIIGSTRPGRVGLPVGNWFVERAKKHAMFDVVLADLKTLDLPLLDEPKHPRLGQYEHAHTKAWSAQVKAADAFVIVTPEYNFGSPPALVNALDYLYNEWCYKPAAFVSYGGASGGMRGVQMTKQIMTTLKMAPIYEAVNIPFVQKLLTPDGITFQTNESYDNAAKLLLDELHRWAVALKTMR